MEFSSVMDFVTGLLAAVGGWLFKTTWGRIDSVERRIQDMEVEMPSEYVNKADLDKLEGNLTKKFDKLDRHVERIFEKMEHKADK